MFRCSLKLVLEEIITTQLSHDGNVMERKSCLGKTIPREKGR